MAKRKTAPSISKFVEAKIREHEVFKLREKMRKNPHDTDAVVNYVQAAYIDRHPVKQKKEVE